MLKVTVSNTQEAQAQIRKALREFATNRNVTVGFHEDQNNNRPNTEGGTPEPTNVIVAVENHFGNGNIPARPFLDVGVASKNQLYIDTIKEVVGDGGDLEQALNAVGVTAVSAVQEYMNNVQSPPNSPETVKKKGFNNPLVHTGELKQAVTYKLVSVKPKEGL